MKDLVVNSLGTLKTEQILVEQDYPMLFVSNLVIADNKEEENSVFLIINVDNDNGVLVAYKSNYSEILKLFNYDKRVNLKTFCENSKVIYYIVYDYSVNEYIANAVNYDDLSAEDKVVDKLDLYSLREINPSLDEWLTIKTAEINKTLL